MSNSSTSSDNDDGKDMNENSGNNNNNNSSNRQPLDLPQSNPFSKGRLPGAKNYVSAENFVIIEAIARRKAHYSWRDDNIWRAVATEVSNSTAHERTPAQIADHFKKMVTAVRSAITELFVNTKLTWPTRTNVDDEETLQADRVIYIAHLLTLMCGKGSSKKFFSRNWWSESVLLRLVELINSDEGRDYNTNETGYNQYEVVDGSSRRHTVNSNESQSSSSSTRNINTSPQNKRKRDDVVVDDDIIRLPSLGMDRSKSEVLEETIIQVNYTKHVTENLAQSLSSTNNHQKLLESRIKELEDNTVELKHEINQLRGMLEAIVNHKPVPIGM